MFVFSFVTSAMSLMVVVACFTQERTGWWRRQEVARERIAAAEKERQWRDAEWEGFLLVCCMARSSGLAQCRGFWRCRGGDWLVAR